jgi:hypothetical protein
MRPPEATVELALAHELMRDADGARGGPSPRIESTDRNRDFVVGTIFRGRGAEGTTAVTTLEQWGISLHLIQPGVGYHMEFPGRSLLRSRPRVE